MTEREAIWDLQEYIGSGAYNGSEPPIYLMTAQLAIKALEKQIDGGWIPVEEGLPKWEIEEDYTEDVHTVLQWWDGDITYGVGWYRKNFGWSEDGVNCKVIAWKPIAPYQKGE